MPPVHIGSIWLSMQCFGIRIHYFAIQIAALDHVTTSSKGKKRTFNQNNWMKWIRFYACRSADEKFLSPNGPTTTRSQNQSELNMCCCYFYQSAVCTRHYHLQYWTSNPLQLFTHSNRTEKKNSNRKTKALRRQHDGISQIIGLAGACEADRVSANMHSIVSLKNELASLDWRFHPIHCAKNHTHSTQP